MKTIKIKNIKELVEMIVDMEDDDFFSSLEYFGVDLSKTNIDIGYYSIDNEGDTYFESYTDFIIDLKGNILKLFLDLDSGRIRLIFEAEEPFKKGTYRIKNQYYKKPEKEEPEIIDL